MDTSTEDFTSLQERCLLHLITHVEDYSPQTLALLPRHLRRALLSSVAPLHLYQLDQTEVASGIDTEALWKVVFDLVYRSPGRTEFQETNADLRKRFVNIVSHEILYDRTARSSRANAEALKLHLNLLGLFKGCLSSGMICYLRHTKGPYVFISDHCFVGIDTEAYEKCPKNICKSRSHLLPFVIPPRLTFMKLAGMMTNCLCSHAQQYFHSAARFVSLLDKAGAYPNELRLDVERLLREKLWMPDTIGPIRPFLNGKTVTDMSIRVHDLDPASFRPGNLILETFCNSSTELSLEVLEVAFPVSDDTLASIAPALAAHGGLKYVKLVLEELGESTATRHYAAPLDHIITSQKELQSVLLCERQTGMVAMSSVATLARHYRALQHLNVSEFGDEKLISSLCSLLHKESFHQLSLEGFAMTDPAVRSIIAAFFESSNEGSLTLLDITFRENSSIVCGTTARQPVVNISKEHASKFELGKKLELTSKTIPASFVKWFGYIPHIFFSEVCTPGWIKQCDSIENVPSEQQNFKANNFVLKRTVTPSKKREGCAAYGQ